jgi:uncharacterized protein
MQTRIYKHIFYLIIWLFLGQLSAQKLYFPREFYATDLKQQESLPLLAKSLVMAYEDDDSSNYYNNVLRYKILANEYDGALSAIQASRKFDYSASIEFAKGVYAQFETFILAKKKHEILNTDFKTIYLAELKKKFESLNDRAAYEFLSYFKQDTNEIKANFIKVLNSINSNSDSISIEMAKRLCRLYNSYNIYRQIIPISQSYISQLSLNQLVIEDSVLIKTKSGVILSARIARKKNQKVKLPCIMQMSIYASKSDQTRAVQAALNGYVGIVVNTRGKYLSPDSIIPYEYDGKDAYDAIDWISKQEWCDGRVGMYGGSYLGFTQWTAAKQMHPALKTIVPQVPVLPGLENVYRGGVFITNELANIHDFTKSKFIVPQNNLDNEAWSSVYLNWYKSGRTFGSLDTLEGRPNEIFQNYIKHPSYDAYWQNMVPYKSDYAKINIPILSITGHFDGNLRGSFYYFKEHYKYNKNANHYMLFGPYDHFGAQGNPSNLSDFKMDPVANLSIYELVWEWFDYVFKGKSKPFILKDKLNYEVIGANNWKHASSISKVSNEKQVFYFNSELLNNHYSLSRKTLLKDKFINQVVDFKDRSDSTSLNVFVFTDSTNAISNSITLVTEPINSDIEINGEFELNLVFVTNKMDMDIEATLIEVKPDGEFFILSEVTNRLSYLKDRTKRQLLKPNKKTFLSPMIGKFVSKKISVGSKLKLVLRVLKSPYQQINYGTGKDVSTESIKDAGEPLQIKWYNDSYIKIPVWRPVLSKVEGDRK